MLNCQFINSPIAARMLTMPNFHKLKKRKSINSPIAIIIFLSCLVSCGGEESSDPKEEEQNKDTLVNLLEPLHPKLSHTALSSNIFRSALSEEQQLYLTAQLTPRGFSLIKVDTLNNKVSALTDLPSFSSVEQGYIPNLNAMIKLVDQRLFIIGKESKRLLSGDERVSKYWLSPDHKKVLFTANYIPYDDEKGSRDLYISDIASGEIVQLNQTSKHTFVAETSLYYDVSDPNNQRPRFSEDMSKVVFFEVERSDLSDGIVFTYSLHSVNLDGTKNTRLASDIASGGSNTIDVYYTLTADSKKIIYCQYVNGVVTGIYSINLDGSNKTQLSPSSDVQGVGKTPSYVSNNTIIFPYSLNGEDYRLYRNNLAGNELLDLTLEQFFNAKTKPIIHNSYIFYIQDNGSGYGGNRINRINQETGEINLINADMIESVKNISYLLAIEGQQSIFYSATDIQTNKRRLYNSSFDGESTEITKQLDAEKKLDWFLPSKDGKYVAFNNAGTGAENPKEVYVAKSDGSATIKISPDTINGGSGYTELFNWYDGKLYFKYGNTNDAYDYTGYSYHPVTGELKPILSKAYNYIDEDVIRVSSSKNKRVIFTKDNKYKTPQLYINNGHNSCSMKLESDERVFDSYYHHAFMPESNLLVFRISGKGLFYADNNCSRIPITSPQDKLERKNNLLIPLESGIIASNNDRQLIHIKEDFSIKVLYEAKEGASSSLRYLITPDNEKVLIWSDGDESLYQVRIDSGETQKIPLDGFKDLRVEITKDSDYAIIVASSIENSKTVHVLKTSLINGETEELVSENNTRSSDKKIKLSDDEKTIIYTIGNYNNYALMAIPTSGGSSVMLNQNNAHGRFIQVRNIPSHSPDQLRQFPFIESNNKVTYIAEKEGANRIFQVNIDGTNNIELTSNLDRHLSASNILLDNNPDHLTFMAYTQGVSNSAALYRLSLSDHSIETSVVAGDYYTARYVPVLNSLAIRSPLDEHGAQKLTLLNLTDNSQRVVKGYLGDDIKVVDLDLDEKSFIIIGDFFTKGVREAAKLPLDLFK